jgi:hypothetical protein
VQLVNKYHHYFYFAKIENLCEVFTIDTTIMESSTVSQMSADNFVNTSPKGEICYIGLVDTPTRENPSGTWRVTFRSGISCNLNDVRIDYINIYRTGDREIVEKAHKAARDLCNENLDRWEKMDRCCIIM